MSVVSYIELLAENGSPGARFVLARGRTWGPPIPRPKGMRKGHAKGCYKNAAERILGHSEWRYVEGYARPLGLGELVAPHAWIADEADRVIETTWSAPGSEYFGVPFTEAEMLRGWNRVGCFCLLCGVPRSVAFMAELQEPAAS
jgi:hypothetical protein